MSRLTSVTLITERPIFMMVHSRDREGQFRLRRRDRLQGWMLCLSLTSRMTEAFPRVRRFLRSPGREDSKFYPQEYLE